MKQTAWVTLASLALLLSGTPLWAASNDSMPYSAAYQACLKNSDDTDPAIQQCQRAELVRMDAALNVVYRDLTAKLEKTEPNRKPLLVTAERTWLAYRDSQCEFWAPLETARSADLMAHNDCRLKITNQRIADLAQALDIASFLGG